MGKINEQIEESKDRIYEYDKDFLLKFSKPNAQITNLLSKVEEINDKKNLTFQEKKRLLLSHIL